MKIKAMLLIILVTMLVISGCKENHCYRCYQFGASFLAIKDTDTINVGILNKYAVQDSVNRYTVLGYSINKLGGGYSPDPCNLPCCSNNNNSGAPYQDSCVIAN